MKINKNSSTKVLSILLPIVVITFLIFMAGHNLKDFNFAMTLLQLRELGTEETVLLAVIAALAVSSMMLYDLILIKSFSYKMKVSKIFQISWISNTFNNFLGFAGVTGAGTRFFLYKRSEIEDSDAYKMSLLLLPATVTGLSILSIMSLVGVAVGYGKFIVSNKILFAGVLAVSLYLPVYLFYQKLPVIRTRVQNSFSDTSIIRKSRYSLLFASFVEWFFALILFYSITLSFGINLNFMEVLILFSLAASGGVISLVPGGLGSFDLIAILGLGSLGIHTNIATAIILIYRILYFIIPWFVGMILLSFNYAAAGKTGTTKKISHITGIISDASELLFSRELSAKLLSFFVFFSGFLLLLSAAYPGISYRLEYLSRIIPLQVMALSHNISIIAGVILIVLSYGILQRTKRAYYLTIFFLGIGSVFTFIKGGDFEEMIFLGIVASLLVHSKKTFYRESTPLVSRFIIFNLLITSVLLLLYAVFAEYLHTFYHAHIHFKVILFHGQNRYIDNAILAFGIAWLVIILQYLLTKKKTSLHPKLSEDDFIQLENFLSVYEGSNLTHFAYLGDKNFFWYREKVLILYSFVSNYFIALGDPVGDRKLFSEAIEAFQDFADKSGIKTAFYQIKKDYLDLYHDNGYNFIKLGEDAIIDLPDFDLSGKTKRGLRTVRNRFTNQGFSFTHVEKPFSEDLLGKMEIISTEWLDGRKEKGFSLGKFDRSYIEKSELLLLKDSTGTLLAFVTIIPPYSQDNMVAIDLMRYGKDAPNGTMDFLFINMILWAKEKGFRYLSLEMAPLSNVGRGKYSSNQEKLIKFIFSYGNKWYNFHGLRRYKEKFEPRWIPRYLAYPNKSSVYKLLLKITRLISR